MPHITVSNDLPGIRGLVAFRPEMGHALYELAETLLRTESPLSRADRELIAAHVSSLNQCHFCTQSHAAAARHLCAEGEAGRVDAVLADPRTAPVSDRLRALLAIAAKVQAGGRNVAEEDVARARAEGASDVEIHDTVLVAAAFCMFNRYVDGLASWAPADPAAYDEMGRRMAEQGYTARFAQVVQAPAR
jgi:uncharacterized peroxidase-related enzyme